MKTRSCAAVTAPSALGPSLMLISPRIMPAGQQSECAVQSVTYPSIPFQICTCG